MEGSDFSYNVVVVVRLWFKDQNRFFVITIVMHPGWWSGQEVKPNADSSCPHSEARIPAQ